VSTCTSFKTGDEPRQHRGAGGQGEVFGDDVGPAAVIDRS